MPAGRRRFLAASAGFALTPLAGLLAACGRPERPDEPVEIKWDRDICIRCNMVISDRRFAAQARGGPKGQRARFDDIGCAVFWLNAQPWGSEPATRIWVADSTGGETWLDARSAHYVSGKRSPMGYNFAAVREPRAGSLDFATLQRELQARGK